MGMNDPIWLRQVQMPQFQSLHGNRKTDVLIVGGTSLIVYPAAGLIDYYPGKKLVLINKTPTSRDNEADLVIREPIGQVFSQL